MQVVQIKMTNFGTHWSSKLSRWTWWSWRSTWICSRTMYCFNHDTSQKKIFSGSLLNTVCMYSSNTLMMIHRTNSQPYSYSITYMYATTILILILHQTYDIIAGEALVDIVCWYHIASSFRSIYAALFWSIYNPDYPALTYCTASCTAYGVIAENSLCHCERASVCVCVCE